MKQMFPNSFESIEAAVVDGHGVKPSFNAKEILFKGSEALIHLAHRADAMLEAPIEMLLACPGKVLVSGVGKSGLVARKIGANLNCMGVSAVFLHPTEAMHGDIGLVSPGDLAILVSHSGETEELIGLAHELRRRNIELILVTSNLSSRLSFMVHAILSTGVTEEAGAYNFLPTTSNLCAMALGDLLCLGLMDRKQTALSKLKANHPGGTLGACGGEIKSCECRYPLI